MKISKSLNLILVLTFLITASSCKSEQKDQHLSHALFTDEVLIANQPELPVFGNLVEVKSTGMNFILPDEIPSGWTTFRYSNVSPVTHFMLMDKLPVVNGKQITYTDFGHIAPIFGEAMQLINEGKAEKGFAEFSKLPSWFSDIIFSGGVGLVSPGETAQTTIYVEPGTYVVECYVKTNGIFHPMTKQLIVRESFLNILTPKATIDLEISREGGIEMPEEVQAGLQTIAVHFKDQVSHEHFMGHDVHIVKLEKDTDLVKLNSWMTWTTPDGLNTPAPVKFLGGAQEMPAGSTAYITVDLKPGKYALIAEVPDPASKNMLKTFTVQ
ncbi:MAG: hypothetical protein ABJ092_14035 [Gillisia sp.]